MSSQFSTVLFLAKDAREWLTAPGKCKRIKGLGKKTSTGWFSAFPLLEYPINAAIQNTPGC